MANSCQRWVYSMQFTKKSEIKKKTLPSPYPKKQPYKKVPEKKFEKRAHLIRLNSHRPRPSCPAPPGPPQPESDPPHYMEHQPLPTHTLKSNIRFQKNRKNEGAPNAKGEGAFSQWSNQRLGITCKNVLEVWKLSTVRWARYYLWDLANLFITCVVL